jgi:Plasmid pRiA4b ORF-3-like protein
VKQCPAGAKMRRLVSAAAAARCFHYFVSAMSLSPVRPSAMEVYAIKVTLIGTRPPVWRRILVPRDITLRNLHRTLQTVMGWTNAHLHQFVLPGTRNFGLRQGFGGKIGNENRTTLGALLDFPGAKLLYEYDFGDCWRHELLLERVLLGDESFRQVCVAGERVSTRRLRGSGGICRVT